jgi:hypothetical protein
MVLCNNSYSRAAFKLVLAKFNLNLIEQFGSLLIYFELNYIKIKLFNLINSKTTSIINKNTI